MHMLLISMCCVCIIMSVPLIVIACAIAYYLVCVGIELFVCCHLLRPSAARLYCYVVWC